MQVELSRAPPNDHLKYEKPVLRKDKAVTFL